MYNKRCKTTGVKQQVYNNRCVTGVKHNITGVKRELWACQFTVSRTPRLSGSLGVTVNRQALVVRRRTLTVGNRQNYVCLFSMRYLNRLIKILIISSDSAQETGDEWTSGRSRRPTRTREETQGSLIPGHDNARWTTGWGVMTTS